jgi:hypothetical protein
LAGAAKVATREAVDVVPERDTPPRPHCQLAGTGAVG